MLTRVEKRLEAQPDVTVKHAGGPHGTLAWDRLVRQRIFIAQFRARCSMECDKNNWGSEVAHPAIHMRCGCEVAPPPPRQYSVGDHASSPAIEAAWRAQSARGTLRRFEADAGKPAGGSAQRGEVARGASARGRAQAICLAREAAEKMEKRQC